MYRDDMMMNMKILVFTYRYIIIIINDIINIHVDYNMLIEMLYTRKKNLQKTCN